LPQHLRRDDSRPRADDPLPGQCSQRGGKTVRLQSPVAQHLNLPIWTLPFEEQEAGHGRRQALLCRIGISKGQRKGAVLSPIAHFNYRFGEFYKAYNARNAHCKYQRLAICTDGLVNV